MHQSVYDKALAIFQEGAKNLEIKTQAIDRERIQSSIEHKLEERKIKQDLLTMIKEKNRLENESQREGSLMVRREKTFGGLDAIRKRQKMSNLERQKSQDCFPPITCTTANVPRIMRRNLSNESEFYNWVTGLPKIANRSIVSLRPVTRDNDAKPTTADSALPPKTLTNTETPTSSFDVDQRRFSKVSNIANNESPTSSSNVDQRRFSKVSNIVYSVPLFSGQDRKLVKSYSFPSVKHKISLPKLRPKTERRRIGFKQTDAVLEDTMEDNRL